MKWFLVVASVIGLFVCGGAYAQECSMVGNAGYGISGCFAAPGQQVQLTANGVTGSFCSFSDNNSTCCYIGGYAGLQGGICVPPSQVVGYVDPREYSCAIPQPASVTACPRCGVQCTASAACGGNTDGCSLCKLYSTNPWGPSVYKCASTAKRGDVCLNEDGSEEVSC